MSATDSDTLAGALACDGLGELGSASTDAVDGRLANVHNAIVELRASSCVDDALAATAGQLARTAGFARVLLSRIEGSLWIPQYWHSVALGGDDEGVVEAQICAMRVPMHSSMIEADVVRRRWPRLVVNARTDPRAHQPFVDAIRARSYVVAPIIVGEEAIALLHADYGAHRHPVSDADLDVLRCFADGLGLALESIALSQRIAQEREHIRAALRNAESVLNAEQIPTMHLVDSSAAERQPLAVMPHAHPWGLSDREAAVLSLMAEGLTNREISVRLFVSESTVKSHVKHIFKKQGATTRSESIAQVLRRQRRQEAHAS